MSNPKLDNRCIVVFPVYKSLSKYEYAFLVQGVAMTKAYKHIFVAPSSFVLDDTYGSLKDLDILRFDDAYFANIEGYNNLMLSEQFYAAFSEYKYILIHQTDAYLFSPDLSYWLDKEYDYVGASWVKPNKTKKSLFYNDFLYKILPNRFPKSNKRKIYECYNAVGNGGLSLRKTSTFLHILKSQVAQNILTIYRKKLKEDSLYNEDIFWSIEAPHILATFAKPKWKEALMFAMETHISYALSITDGKLPFGCHAPMVYEPHVWQKYIPILNDKSDETKN